MSTRSTTHFINSQWNDNPQAIIYRHSDGYPTGAGADILRFFDEVEAQTSDTRHTDASYLAAKYVVFLSGIFAEHQARTYDFESATWKQNEVKPLHFLSVGVVNQDPGDIEYRYTVDCGKIDDTGRPTVTVQTVGWADEPDGEPEPVEDAINAERNSMA